MLTAKNFQHAQAEQVRTATGHPFALPGQPQNIAVHRQHTAMRMREAREGQPEELLAASLMMTARSEATATAVNVESLCATGQ